MAQAKPSWVTQVEKERREKGMVTVPVSTPASAGSASSGGGRQSAGSGGYQAIGDWYGDSQMSAAVQNQLKEYGNAYNAATTDAQRQAAHDAAEALRAQYGYSGGVDGSQTILLPQQQQTYRPSYSKPSYVNRYQDLIDQLTGQIVDRDPFSYNYQDDPLWQQLQGSYGREGERAMQDTLGQVAARTGGMASSYAASAANQANNYYMAQLNDKIPELQQLAYSMYQDDADKDRLNLQMIQALESGDYAKYQDLLAQYNTDRSFDYNAWRDQIADSRYDTQWDYEVGRDQVSDDRYSQETAYEQALNRWKLTGTVSAADAAILGVPAGTGYGVYQAASGGSKGGSGGSKSAGSGTGEGDESIYETLKSRGATDYGTAFAWLIQQGHGSTAADQMARYYEETYLPGSGTDEYEGATVDLASVISLGYGPVSEARLAELEASGEIESYVENGKIKFRRVDRGGGDRRYDAFDLFVGGN